MAINSQLLSFCERLRESLGNASFLKDLAISESIKNCGSYLCKL